MEEGPTGTCDALPLSRLSPTGNRQLAQPRRNGGVPCHVMHHARLTAPAEEPS